jgi:hypothetical protein
MTLQALLCSGTLLSLWAQTPLVRLSGIVYDQNSVPLEGTITIELENDSLAITDFQKLSLDVYKGRIDLFLAPTAIDAYYEVNYYGLAGVLLRQEQWQVPSTTDSLKPQDVLVKAPSTPVAVPASNTGASITLPISINQVAGLSGGLASINHDIVQVNTSIGNVQSQVTGMDSQVTLATTSISAANATISSLLARVTGNDSNILALQSAIATLAASVAENSKKIALLQTSINAIAIPSSTLVTTSVTGTPVSSQPTFVDAEVPAGDLNGVNLSFILQQSPNPQKSLLLFKNGVLLRSGGDYTINGSTLTFTLGAQPVLGDTLLANYRY